MVSIGFAIVLLSILVVNSISVITNATVIPAGAESIWGVVRHFDDEKYIYKNNIIADAVYMYIGFGGNITGNGHHKFILYYDVVDRDQDQFNDERVAFYTQWYYGLLYSGSGGGGGGHAQPMLQNSIFDPIIIHSYKPEDGDGGDPVSVTVSYSSVGVSFELFTLGGWSADLTYSTDDNGNPTVTLFQETGWIDDANVGIHNGGQATDTDYSRWINHQLWGPRLFFETGVYYPTEGYLNVNWYIPIGLLAMGVIGEPGQ